jgi:hypothetical protein
VVPFLPEFPRWLVANSRIDDAVDSLVRLGAKVTMPESPEVDKTMTEIKEVAHSDSLSGLT